MTTREEFAAQLKALQRQYVQSLPAKKQAIETAWQNLQQHGFETERVKALAKLSHDLAGSGGLYDLPQLSRTGMEIEVLLSAVLTDNTLTPDKSQQVGQLVGQLGQALDEAIAQADC